MRILSLVFMMLVLAACSGGSGSGGRQQRPVLPDFPDASGEILPEQRSLVYAYPAPGQTEIIPGTPIILRFSHPLAAPSPTAAASLFVLRDMAAGQSVAFSLKVLDGGKGVVLQPTLPLKENTVYRIIAADVELTSGKISVQAVGQPPLEFRTRAALSGPARTQVRSALNEFSVLNRLPNPGVFPLSELDNGFPLVDFSSIRLQLSQPVDGATATYGTAVRLEQGDELVPARLLVNGNHMTIDPVADLDPTKTYTLKLANTLRSRFGQALAPGAYAALEIRPRDSGSAAGQLSRIKIEIPSGGASLLTGTPINQVPVASPLLGQGDRAPKPQAGGSLFADLAYAPNFGDFKPAIVPLRVPRNNELSAASLVVMLDGRVPANLETGNLKIKLLSDANGLLLPNRYSLSPAAPALVMLEMDIALSAQDPTSNGAFTQDLLHVAVSGIATVDQASQKLTIEAVGTIELKILGVDDAVGVLALKLESNLQGEQGDLPEDRISPTVQSWVPGGVLNGVAGGELVRPGDPIIVNFDKLMDIDSFRSAGAISLRKANIAEPFSWRLDGASLVITPTAPLAHGVLYSLSLTSALKDMSGNSLVPPAPMTFTLPGLATTAVRPPVALSTYPGYPCAIAAGSRNVSGNIQGRCAGGKSDDDLLPLPAIDPRRDIVVALSQSLNPASVRLGTACNAAASFRVERVDVAGNCLGVVPGRLTVKPRELLFKPDEPWVRDQLYRYVLGSNNSLTSSAADCSGTQAICGSNGLPLQTQLISQALADARNSQRGGPPMEIFFKGGTAPGGTSIGLRVLPVLDVNANFRFDDSERRSVLISNPATVCKTGQGSDTPATTGRCIAPNGALLQPDRMTLGTGKSYNGAATAFALGCENGIGSEDESSTAVGRDCQGNQFLLISAALGARLGSSVDLAGKPAIEVFIDPSVVVTSGAHIYADLGLTPDSSPISQTLFDALRSIPILGPIIGDAVDTGAGLIDGLLPIGVRDETNTELEEGHVYTGPLVFRMRHPAGNGPIRGYITSETALDGSSKLVLEAGLDLYTDIPEINPVATILGQPAIPIEHAVRSSPDLTASADPARGAGTVRVRGEVRFLPDGRMTVQLSNIEPVRLTASLSALGGLLAGDLKVRVPAGRFIIDASLAPVKQ